MHACPECRSELPQVYVTVDSAHHLLRTWCPFCRVWWSVKYRKEDARPLDRPRQWNNAVNGEASAEKLAVQVCP